MVARFEWTRSRRRRCGSFATWLSGSISWTKGRPWPAFLEKAKASNEGTSSGGEGHGTVIITVVTVGVMQMTVHQIVDVVTVRNRFVATAWAVNVVRVMTRAFVFGCAGVRVGV